VIKESSPTDFAVEQTVLTPARAKTITLDTKTGNLFLITAEYGPMPTPPAPPAGTAPPSGAPGGMREMRAPMIPHSFQILEVGKD
jgi:hypothetical protein